MNCNPRLRNLAPLRCAPRLRWPCSPSSSSPCSPRSPTLVFRTPCRASPPAPTPLSKYGDARSRSCRFAGRGLARPPAAPGPAPSTRSHKLAVSRGLQLLRGGRWHRRRRPVRRSSLVASTTILTLLRSYWCAMDNVAVALNACMTSPSYISLSTLYAATAYAEAAASIDSTRFVVS